MLVADGGWPGIVLHLGQRFRRVEVQGTELEAGAATPLPSLAARSAKASLGGIAFAVAIPGTVGGGVRMNAGAHGSELADRLLWADVFHLTGEPSTHPPSGRAVRMKPDELGLSYRRSALPPGAVVTAARFALTPAPEATVRAEIDEARRWRRDNQPVNQPNCGSVFANPPEMAAGQVVELLGMKGEAAGGARVSDVHANFIVAAYGATSADVLVLVRRAMRRARDELGITLRTEVQCSSATSARRAPPPPRGGPAVNQRIRLGRADGRAPGGAAAATGGPADRRAAQGDRRGQGAAPAAVPRLGAGRPRPGRRRRLPDPGRPLFGLSAVRVEGTEAVARTEVLEASKVRLGEPYLGLDLAAIRGRVAALPRVADVRGTRDYPSSLRITVTERPPVASVSSGSVFWLVAADGTVLDAAGRRPADLPYVASVPLPSGIRPGSRLPPGNELANALTALGGMAPQLKRQVTGVNARTLDSLEFTLKDGSRVLYGLAVDQPAKDAAVQLIRRTLKREGREAQRIDVPDPVDTHCYGHAGE